MGISRGQCYLLVCCFLTVLCGVAGRKNKPPYLSQFESDVTFKSQKSTPLDGAYFQYMRVSWVRQTQGYDNGTVMVGYDAQGDDVPRVAWLANGILVLESDRSFPQEVTSSWFTPLARYMQVASITIPHAIGVTSLQLLLVLDTIETLTDVNLQSLEKLEAGRSIMEIGTDVALALSPEEDVTFNVGDDVIFLARFFAEEMTVSASDSLKVRYLRMLPTNPDVTLEIVTSKSKPSVLTNWKPRSEELPSSIHKHLKSYLRRHRMVKITEDVQNVRGLVEFTGSYRSNATCRLFGGQKITRRAFVRARGDMGGYWGRGGPMVFLPFQRSVPVICGSNVDVSVTALGESSPHIYLVKDGQIRENGNGVTIILFHRLLQTEAVFRFENVTPEMSGTYLVWAENGLGRTDETSFSLDLDEDC